MVVGSAGILGLTAGSASAQSLADDLFQAAGAPLFVDNLQSTAFDGGTDQGVIHTQSRLDFPLEGDSYIELNNGPGNAGGDGGTSPDGETADDVFTLSATVHVPSNAQSLRFAYRFATDESETTTSYFDYFTAEVDGTNVALLPDGSHVDVRTVDDVVGYPENSTWDYDSISPLLEAEVDVSGMEGSTVDLAFTIADVGDRIVDSAAIIDNIEFTGDCIERRWSGRGDEALARCQDERVGTRRSGRPRGGRRRRGRGDWSR